MKSCVFSHLICEVKSGKLEVMTLNTAFIITFRANICINLESQAIHPNRKYFDFVIESNNA